MADDRLDLIRLNLAGSYNARRYERVVERFGGLREGLRAPLEALAGALGRDMAAAVHVVRPEQAEREAARAAEAGVRILCWGDADYPELLTHIHDPPVVLYVLGELRRSERAVALVGARRATPYGRRMAERLARGLGESAIAVVSGLARGIDAAAHRGAMIGGGRTIAVLGSGLFKCYPPEHEALMREVSRHGAVISEFPLDAPPVPFHFPRRNRIISGLCKGTCVIEAAEKSGSLITAEWAVEQGRDVLAVPHRADDPGATGCHRLIRDGAAIVEGVDDIIYELKFGPGRSRARELEPTGSSEDDTPMGGFSPVEARIFGLLGPDPRPIDEVIEEAALPASTVFATLTTLELKRVVKGWPGRLYQRS